MSRYFFNIILLFLLGLTAAKGQGKYIPDGVRVGANLKNLAITLLDEQVYHFEITGDISFHKYLLTVDLGQAKMTRRGESFRYLTDGTYYKAGIDINFLHELEGNNVLGLGFRYARSDFRNELNWRIANNTWGTQAVNFRNGKVSSGWFEGLVTLKADSWYNLQLGFTTGLKFLKSVKGDHNVEVYEVPGYGYHEAPTLWSFNYFIYYHIPLKK